MPDSEEEAARKSAMLELESEASKQPDGLPRFPKEVWVKIREAHLAHPRWNEYRLATYLNRKGVYVHPHTVYRFLYPDKAPPSRNYR